MQFDQCPPIVIKPLQQEPEQTDSHVHSTGPYYAAADSHLGGIPLSHFENQQEEEKRKILEAIYKNERWYCPLCQISFTSKFTLQRHLMGASHQKDDLREWLRKVKVVTSESLSGISLLSHLKNQQEDEKRKREILEVIYKDDRWHCPLCKNSFSAKFALQRHLQGGLHDQNDPKVKEWLQKISGRLHPRKEV